MSAQESCGSRPVRLPEEGNRGPGGRLGLAQGVALYLASVLGTGLLVLPGLAAHVAGPASLVAVAAVTVLAIPLAGTFAALAARYPDPGGVASYVRRALGPTAARATGYWFLFGVAAGGPVVAVLGARYIATIVGIDAGAVPVLALAFLALPFAANLLGVRVTGWIQLLLTGLLLAVVVLVVALAAPAVEPAHFEPFLPHGWGGVGTAIVMFVWAFAGWEVGTHISGEFARPRRTIPLATAITLVLSGASYLALQVVTVGALGDAAGRGDVVLLDLARAGDLGAAPVLIGAVAGIVAVGVLNVYLSAFAKLGASLASTGDLPRALAKGVENGAVPRRALACTGVLVLAYLGVVVLTGMDLQPFILIHTASMVAIYALGMVAAVRILRRGSLGWWFAVVASILTIGLLMLAGAALVVPAVLAVAAVLVGVVQQRRRRGAPVSRSAASEEGVADGDRSLRG
ncbi:amino acid efflux transporter [Microbacterium resistens]|uniref:Amino acid efflux transporter n=1 Tax=Microbacterium resistens TaxID=156977 RepID=A0ABU1S9T1_9MICO|nr:amino acid permease [Microbacterium resistens]MDR6866381.1 amino acid efflux transporter [Microbacterium resistens]